MSQDNININIQETNDIINIVSSEVTEVIDINVGETVEEVTLNITEEIIQVNINKVTGGGGNQTLAETLALGNVTGGENIVINDADSIQLENSSTLKKGTYNYGGNGGISRICSNNYEDMWQNGFRHVFDQSGFIRNSTNCFDAVPDSSFDVTLRFKIGSIWTLDNGTNYICTDATEGAAVWELYNVIPTNTSDLTNDSNFVSDASYVHTDNNFTTAEQTKLAGIEAGAEVNVNADWNATSGDAEILNKPTIPSLTGYVPYTGATTDVNLGEYEIKAGQITFDTSPTGTAAVATTRWNNTIGSAETTLKGGSVVLKNGVDLVARVVNKVSPNTTLTKAAYQVVRVSGAQGQRLAVELAQANNDNNSADTLGIVCETIAANQEGFIMTVGQLLDINTTGSLQGETWADGDVLYLSPTTAGRITNIKPTGATGHIVVLGYVEYAHAIHGSIYVKIMNGWELDELHNVYISSVADKQLLSYDSATSLWKNKSVTTDDIADSTNKRYVTDANLTTIGNQSGTNTGDNAVNSLYSGLATSKQDTLVSGTNIKTINSTSVLGSGNITTGTVTSVSALTLGTTGSDLSSSVANGTTTPVITLNVPTASATNRGVLSSTDWSTFNGKQNALLDIASVQDNGIYSTFMNGAISYFLGGVGAATFNNLRINSNLTLSGNSANFSNNAVQFSTTAVAGTLAFQRGTPFYHSGRTLMRFLPNIVSTDARYFVGLSNLYQVSNPTNVDPASLTQTIGVAKFSTSTNLFIIHNDGSGVCTTFDLGANYPGTSTSYIYDIKIISNSAGVYTGVTVRRTTISTGATISTDYTVTSNYPTGVSTNPALWITNNASATANSLLHFGAIGYNTYI